MSAQSNLTVKIGVDLDKLKTELNKANSMFGNLKSYVSGIGTAVAGAFAIENIARFTLEVTKLAGEAQGVRTAFDKFEDSAALLERLKKATAGTVSELELMKRATQAANFGISLEALPKLLEFASVRAQQTGQSVDYLVDSIVTGIGRKSTLILDNLGISAVELKKALNGVSTEAATVGQVADAVGKIAADSLQKTGAIAETSVTKIARLEAEWMNLKVALGEVSNSNSELGTSFDTLTDTLIWFRENLDSILKYIDNYIKYYVLVIPRLVVGAIQKVKDLVFGTKEELKQLTENSGATEPNLPPLLDPKTFIKVAEAVKVSKKEFKAHTEEIENYVKAARMAAGLSMDTPTTSITGGGFLQGMGLTGLGATVEGEFQTIQTSMTNFIPMLNDFSLQVNDIINNGIINGFSGLGQAIGDIASGLGGGELIFASLLNAFGTMATQLGELAIGAGVGVEAIKKSLESLNGPVAIAAGIALVALGRAVSNKAKSIAKGGGGGSVGGSGSGLPSRGTVGNTQQIQLIGNVKVTGKDIDIALSNYANSNKSRKG